MEKKGGNMEEEKVKKEWGRGEYRGWVLKYVESKYTM